MFTVLQFPGSLDSAATGINDRGTIVGNWDTDPTTVGHGFVFDRGSFTTFDVPGASGTFPGGINSRGEITGVSYDAQGGQRGFVLDDDTFSTFDVPEATPGTTHATSINARGQVVGFYKNLAGQPRGFLAEPAHTHDRNDE